MPDHIRLHLSLSEALKNVFAANDRYEEGWLRRGLHSKRRTQAVYDVWTPMDVDTSVWYDSSDLDSITLVDNRVSQWNDKSGNGNHATQGTAAARPFISEDAETGLNQLLWNGLDINLDSGFSMDWTYDPWTVFIVATAAGSLGGLGGLIGNRFGSFSAWWTLGFNSTIMAMEGGPPFGNDPRGAGKQIYSFNRPSTLMEGFLNGTSTGTATVGLCGGVGSILKLGRWFTTGQQWVGKVQEVIILERVPSVDERKKVEGYLAHKYDLTGSLPGGHPYKSKPPTVA